MFQKLNIKYLFFKLKLLKYFINYSFLKNFFIIFSIFLYLDFI